MKCSWTGTDEVGADCTGPTLEDVYLFNKVEVGDHDGMRTEVLNSGRQEGVVGLLLGRAGEGVSEWKGRGGEDGGGRVVRRGEVVSWTAEDGVEAIRVKSGRVWLTGGVEGRDWVLGVGDGLRWEEETVGRWVVECLGEEAVVDMDFRHDRPGRRV